jgi:hypothetical protein
MIQIKRDGKVIVNDLEALRAEFAQKHCVLLPQILAPDLLEFLGRQLAQASFVTKLEREADEEFGKVLFIPESEPALFVLHLLLNNLSLFEALEHITECGAIGNFTGRIHQSAPGGDHKIDWHGDNADHRLLGLTLNLGDEDYTGGLFQLRNKQTQQVVCELPRKPPGDAFVFRISPGLQHRLTMLRSGGRRTVGVGWFRSHPDLRSFSRDYFKSL